MDIIQYPYDPTGTAETNRVKTVRTLPRVRNRAFAPDGGPFYKDSVVLIDVESGDEIPKSEYDCLYLYSEATERVGQSVCGIINVHNQDYYGAVEAITQVVGGSFSSNVSAIQRMLETLEIDNRKIRFDDLIDVPVTMPPAPHLTWVGDLYGAEALVTALEEIKNAHENADLSMMELIGARYDELYDLLIQVGNSGGDNSAALNAMNQRISENYLEFQNVTSGLQDAITTLSQTLDNKYDELLAKINVNLQSIQSLTSAHNSLALDVSNLRTNLEQLTTTVEDLGQTLQTLSSQLSTHVNRSDNPHGVTATQVGLGNVQNYPVGTLAEMRAGTGSRYALSHIVKQFVEEKIAAIPTGPEYVTAGNVVNDRYGDCKLWMLGNYAPGGGTPYPARLLDGTNILRLDDIFNYNLTSGDVGYSTNPVNTDLNKSGTVSWNMVLDGYKIEMRRSRNWWDLDSGSHQDSSGGVFFEIHLDAVFGIRNAQIYGSETAAISKFVTLAQAGLISLRFEDGPGGAISPGGGTATCPVRVRTGSIQLPYTRNSSTIPDPSYPPTSTAASPYYTTLPSTSDVIWESRPVRGARHGEDANQRLIYDRAINVVYLSVRHTVGGTLVPIMQFQLLIDSARTNEATI